MVKADQKSTSNVLLRKARRARGWTQAQAAEWIGTERGNYSRWERGEVSPSPYYVQRLCEVYGKTAEELGLLEEQTPKSLSQVEREWTREKPNYTNIHGIPIIGRDQDVEDILRMLREGTRYVILTGMPGVGKTELALMIAELAQTQEGFTNVKFFSFDPNLSDVEVALGKINHYLEDKGIDLQKKTLIIPDNCEQLKGFSEELEEILRKYKKLSILATSRTKLSGKNYFVKPFEPPSLQYESLGDLLKNNAVQLFLQGVNISTEKDEIFVLTQHNAQKIVRWCIALEGLPLALLIVGSWIKKLSNELLHTLLLDLEHPFRKEQKSSLDRVIETSYTLLDKPEQMILRRLTVFVDRCRLRAVAEVCSVNNDLQFLSANQVVQPGSMSVISHDKIQQYILSLVIWLNNLSNHHLITFKDEWVAIAHPTIRLFAQRKLDNPEDKLDQEDEEDVDKVKEADRVREQFACYYVWLQYTYKEACNSAYNKLYRLQSLSYRPGDKLKETALEEAYRLAEMRVREFHTFWHDEGSNCEVAETVYLRYWKIWLSKIEYKLNRRLGKETSLKLIKYYMHQYGIEFWPLVRREVLDLLDEIDRRSY